MRAGNPHYLLCLFDAYNTVSGDSHLRKTVNLSLSYAMPHNTAGRTVSKMHPFVIACWKYTLKFKRISDTSITI